MPSWVIIAGTVVISLVSAYGFLRLRCRGTGNPFGHRARWWAITIVVITAAVSPGARPGRHCGGQSHDRRLCRPHPAQRPVAGEGGPASVLGGAAARWPGIWSPWPPSRFAASMTGWATTCRLGAIPGSGRRRGCRSGCRMRRSTTTARSRAGGHRACDQLSRWRESVEHKIRIVRLIDLETTAARLEAALQDHPATRDSRKYAVDDLPRLTRRLIAEAENELHLFLALVYRLGYHSLLIYPFRPEPLPRPSPLRPTASPPGARQRFPSPSAPTDTSTL